MLEASAWLLSGSMLGALIVGALWAAHAVRMRAPRCAHPGTITDGKRSVCLYCGVEL